MQPDVRSPHHTDAPQRTTQVTLLPFKTAAAPAYHVACRHK